MRIRALVTLVPALGLAGLACGGENRSEIEVLHMPTEEAPIAGINVRLEGAGMDRTLTADDFGTTRYITPHTAEMEIPGDGDLRVTFRLFAPGGALFAEGAVTIPVERDRSYAVEARIQSLNPAEGCLGCRDVKAFPLLAPGASERDSLYLVWGSNSISNPVVY